MANLEKLVDDLSALTVLEAAELSKLLEEKWGVSAAAPVAVAAAGKAGSMSRQATASAARFEMAMVADPPGCLLRMRMARVRLSALPRLGA